MWHMQDVGWGWWLVMSVGMVVFWALVIYGVFWLARSGGGGQAPPEQGRESPEEVLRRRLAAGEINLEEYQRLHRAIADQAPPDPREEALR